MNAAQPRDYFFMAKALLLASKAARCDEVPVGALIVDRNGTVIGRGYNQIEKKMCQTAHAELIAISRASKKLFNWRLEGCTLYVTLQPCTMCMGAIRLSRIARVVYGATSPLFGFHLDNEQFLRLYKKDTFEITPGIGQHEAAEILKHFFKIKRDEKA
jgi:tRNA(adenine34) deaminase